MMPMISKSLKCSCWLALNLSDFSIFRLLELFMRPMKSKPEANILDVVDGAQGLSWGPAGAMVLSRGQCRLLFSSHAWHSPRRPASEESCVNTEAQESFLLSKIQPLGTAHSEPKISLIKYDQCKTMGAIHCGSKVLPIWLEGEQRNICCHYTGFILGVTILGPQSVVFCWPLFASTFRLAGKSLQINPKFLIDQFNLMMGVVSSWTTPPTSTGHRVHWMVLWGWT